MSHSPSVPANPHALPLSELETALQTDLQQGLSPAERARRLDHYGPNQLQLAEPISAWRILLSQFQDLMVLILLGAAAIALLAWKLEGAHGLPFDAIIIGAILVLNALLGFVQEYRAEQMMQKLKEVAATSRLRVISEGNSLEVERVELVPGDLIKLQEGDRVPADCILVKADRLRVDESLLTGESMATSKTVGEVAADSPVDSRSGSLFAGTALTAGSATAVVAATANQTELGKLARVLTTTESEETPLQRRLAHLGTQIGWGVLAIAVVVGFTVLWMEAKTDAATLTRVLMFSVALAVAAVPEGLPAVLTVALSIGTKRLASQQAVVRKMSAVETLGSLTVIATDKTGTLTHNQMTVRSVYVDGSQRQVSGEGYESKGTIESSATLMRMLEAGSLASSGDLVAGDKGRTPLGDPVDASLLVLAEKGGLDWRQLRQSCLEIGREPFTSERARMSSLRNREGRPQLFMKGSLEAILKRSTAMVSNGQEFPLDEPLRQRLAEVEHGYAESALRVLAIAEKAEASADLDACHQEEGLLLLGLVAMGDPPRAEARHAVESCRAAGIRVVMATGDHPATAVAVARQVGLAGPDDQPTTGPELEKMSDREVDQRVRTCNVFARVSPAAKLRLVETLLAQKEIVAMTGDGVNDAPALKKVHVGVAMGSGTAVAVEASQVVLLDDNFATIVKAVAGGRRVYRSVQKFIAFLFSGNLGVVVAMFFGALMAGVFHLTDNDGLLLPLTAAQILWMNLAVDGAPAVAFSLSSSNEDVMSEPPRSPDSPILTPDLWRYLIFCGLFVAVALLMALDLLYRGGLFTLHSHDAIYARSAGFYVVVCTRLCNAFNFRQLPGSALRRDFFADPWVPGACLLSWLLTLVVLYWPPLQVAFELVALDFHLLVLLTLLSPLILLPGEIHKRWFSLRLT
ncbi:cation-transporting P-type ATPase [bacterium]|nr:cation-transporting P-type ATPase [bacterium]